MEISDANLTKLQDREEKALSALSELREEEIDIQMKILDAQDELHVARCERLECESALAERDKKEHVSASGSQI